MGSKALNGVKSSVVSSQTNCPVFCLINENVEVDLINMHMVLCCTSTEICWRVGESTCNMYMRNVKYNVPSTEREIIHFKTTPFRGIITEVCFCVVSSIKCCWNAQKHKCSKVTLCKSNSFDIPQFEINLFVILLMKTEGLV